MINRKLLEILVCPICKAKLHFKEVEKELICKNDRLAFPIRNDIPIMLEDEARVISIDEQL